MKTPTAEFNIATSCVQVRYGNNTWCLSLPEAEKLLLELSDSVKEAQLETQSSNPPHPPE